MGNVALEGFGGGSRLNFKVVAGLTQPGSATENTIWVKTEKMTGWIFDANQPENLADGMVWISVDTRSAVRFNALKKNGIQIYPLFAKQYVSGSLVSIIAKSYQNGEWISWWDGALFANGNENTGITGGFVAVGECTLEREDNVLKLRNNTEGGVYPTNKIDLTPFITAKCTLTPLESDETRRLIISRDKVTNDSDAAVVAIGYGGSEANVEATIDVDISALREEYYIGVGRFDSSNQGGTNTDISSIRLEM